ncbi:MAG: hypothetical protein BMS9Abin36_1977 [Gammaproteobacteria bacterium]|nr:MAG: hypothetical protein BMS9Abin36_1977 [Gammaproteobacteria bacterium]
MKLAHATSVTAPLSDIELADIKTFALAQCFKKGQLIFAEGDSADSFYYIEKGRVSVTIAKNEVNEQISVLTPGDYFGEMAILSTNKRNASVTALEETTVLSVDKDKFLEIVQARPEVAEKIYNKFSIRNEELSLKEQLLNSMGICIDNLHVSIKGDPSLRETTFSRERYISVVDPILPQLQDSMAELLLNRCVYRLYLGFNNGEVRVSSVFDPLSTEIHIAQKLTDRGYIDRHFPIISYEDKTNLIRSLYSFITKDSNFTNLPANWRDVFSVSHQQWKPISKSEISNIISKLTDLRAIPNFYVRNINIGIVQDAIRMQFNCDGTHIVNAENFQRFLEENLEVCIQ